jgi:hypothetical protein
MQRLPRIEDLSLECLWVPSGQGLACLWIESRIAASVAPLPPQNANEESKTNPGFEQNLRARAA